MKRPVAVICSNVKHFHETVLIRYVWWDRGFEYTQPSFDEVIELSREIQIPFTMWVFIDSKCHSCRTGVPI
jgi:hypothetical protein